jgi:hypothetical protein
MSYCQINVFKNGLPEYGEEYRNSHGGHSRIWTALFDKYLKDPTIPYDCWLTRSLHDRSLWELAHRKDLPLFERAVHTSTFDYAIVRRENFERYVAHLREFVDTYPAGNYVCHLLAWADFIEGCDEDVEAIGYYGTSCGEDLWFVWDGDKEESVPYDLNTGEKHLEVYEWLEYWEKHREEESEA